MQGVVQSKYKIPTKDMFYGIISEREWIRVKSDHQSIPPRGGHTLNIIGDFILVFGGTSLDDELLLDCWIAPISRSNALTQRIKEYKFNTMV